MSIFSADRYSNFYVHFIRILVKIKKYIKVCESRKTWCVMQKKKKKSIWSAIVREHAIGTSLFNETHGCLSSSLASPSPPKALVLYWTFSTSCLWLCPTDKKSFCFLYRKSIFLFLFLSLYCKRFRHSHFLVAVDPYALEAIYIYII